MSSLKNYLRAIKDNYADIFHRPQGQYETIDGLRAFSVWAVVLFHCFFFTFRILTPEQLFQLMEATPLWLSWAWQGDKGVDIFFIISGFLIGGHVMAEHQKYGHLRLWGFFRKRIFRIMPVYALALVAYGLAQPDKIQWVWANLLLINNFLPAKFFLTPHTWTITVEMQFYLLFPFFFLYVLQKTKHKALLLLGLWLLASLLRVWLMTLNPSVYTVEPYRLLFHQGGDYIRYAEAIYANLYTRIGPFFLGILLGHLHLNKRNEILQFQARFPLASQMLLIFGLGVLTINCLIPYHIPTSWYNMPFSPEFNLWFFAFNRNLFALGGFILMLYCLFPQGLSKPIAWLLSLKIWVPVSKLSYSTYLFHLPFVLVAAVIVHGRTSDGTVLTPLSLLLISGIALLLTMILSSIIYAMLEKPMIDYNHRKLKRVAHLKAQAAAEKADAQILPSEGKD